MWHFPNLSFTFFKFESSTIRNLSVGFKFNSLNKIGEELKEKLSLISLI